MSKFKRVILHLNGKTVQPKGLFWEVAAAIHEFTQVGFQQLANEGLCTFEETRETYEVYLLPGLEQNFLQKMLESDEDLLRYVAETQRDQFHSITLLRQRFEAAFGDLRELRKKTDLMREQAEAALQELAQS